MFIPIFFTSLIISQNVFVDSASSAEQIIKIGKVPDQDSEPVIDINYDSTMRFPMGVVPYFIETASYDYLIVARIQHAMDLIEASSCIVFKRLQFKPTISTGSWIHFSNPEELRECVHGPDFGINGEIIIIIGYECMMSRYILHAVLHGIGFKDEVAHPHRDQYIRILWGNIQPGYHHLFRIQQEDQHKVVEYDPMSVMHFHERAFSGNGGPTIAARLPGLRIKPSEKLSQLDVMKLRLWFGHECNKRKVGALLEKCKIVLHNSHPELKNEDGELSNESVNVDDIVDPYAPHDYGGMGAVTEEGYDEVGGDSIGDEGAADNMGDGNNGGMDEGMDKGKDGGLVEGVDEGVNGGKDGGMDGEMDEGLDGGDGNDLENEEDEDGNERDYDGNAVPDDGVRRKILHK